MVLAKAEIPASWISILIANIISGKEFQNPSRRQMDLLLSWLVGKKNSETNRLNTEIANNFIDETDARKRVLAALDRHLFNPGNPGPLSVLGLNAGAGQTVVKNRYRRLMQIYHPDRSVVSGKISNNRAEAINMAYSNFKNHRPTLKSTTENSNRSAAAQQIRPDFSNGNNCRNGKSLKLSLVAGSAQRIKRKLFLSLFFLSAGFLLLTYVSS